MLHALLICHIVICTYIHKMSFVFQISFEAEDVIKYALYQNINILKANVNKSHFSTSFVAFLFVNRDHVH